MKCFTTDISEEELKYVLYCLGCDLKKINVSVLLTNLFQFASWLSPRAILLLKSTKYQTFSISHCKSKLTEKLVSPSSIPVNILASEHCGHSLRCVKCARDYTASKCTKTPDQAHTCVNCGNDHTVNYRGCPWYKHI